MTSVLTTLSESIAEAVDQAGASIVRVEARRRLPASGIVRSSDGLILTAHHVVERDEGIQIGLPDGNKVGGTVVGRDPNTDLALLKADTTGLKAPDWADASDLRVGHLSLALGRPDEKVLATLGIVSAIGGRRRSRSDGRTESYIQPDVVMYPGLFRRASRGHRRQIHWDQYIRTARRRSRNRSRRHNPSGSGFPVAARSSTPGLPRSWRSANTSA